MGKDIPSVGALRRQAIVSDDEIAAATDAYLADPKAGPFVFTSGHTIDVARAIEMHPPSRAAVAEPTGQDRPNWLRTMVMTAVILGFPVEP